MEDAFFFALLRISIAQILKASGFDKCKPSVLNIITELYIKHLELVIGKAKKFSIARTNAVNDIAAPDVVEALLSIGLIKPTVANDPHDKKNTKSLQSFKDWVQYSDSYLVSKRLSAVPPSLLANLIEKRKIDTSSETDQERKKRRLRERQEYFNQLKQGEDAVRADRADFDDLDEDELTANDKLSWLAYLAEKDMKLGQNMKFVNTCIQDDLMNVHKSKKFHPTATEEEDSYVSFKHQIHNSNKNDHFLIQLQEDEKVDENGENGDMGENKSQHVLPSSHLKSVLPYNIKYDECLADDDLQQYLEYATSHEEEIKERLRAIENGKEDEDGENEFDPENSHVQSSAPVPDGLVTEEKQENSAARSENIALEDKDEHVSEDKDEHVSEDKDGSGLEEKEGEAEKVALDVNEKDKDLDMGSVDTEGVPLAENEEESSEGPGRLGENGENEENGGKEKNDESEEQHQKDTHSEGDNGPESDSKGL